MKKQAVRSIPRPRTGKIARLPHAIREQLNKRLLAGEKTVSILAWLDGLPEVAAVLLGHFRGAMISVENLRQWRAGGYRDWLASQQPRAPRTASDTVPRKPAMAEITEWAFDTFSLDAGAGWQSARCAALAHACTEIDRLAGLMPRAKALGLVLHCYRGLRLCKMGSRVYTLPLSRSTLDRADALWQAADHKTPAVFLPPRRRIAGKAGAKGASADA